MQFTYDGDGNLVKKIKPDGSKTLCVGGVYEVDKNSGGTVIGTKTYYPVAGAMRINSTPYFVLKDHLGSASVVTNKSGVIQGEHRFYPFGETRFTSGTMYTDKPFTGQREMAGLGIYHYGARFYSPKLGRFLSADTIVPGYANPQNLNRFSYVRNNPLRYIDPTGHLIDEGCGCGNTGTTRRTVITVVAGRRTRDSDSGRTFVAWSDLQELADQPTDIRTSRPTDIPTTATTPLDLPTDPHAGPDHYGDEPVVTPPDTTTVITTPIETPPESFTQQSSGVNGAELVAGVLVVGGGLFIAAAGAVIVLAALTVALGITAVATPFGLMVEAPHVGIVGVFGGVTMIIGLGFMALGGYMIYDSLIPDAPTVADN